MVFSSSVFLFGFLPACLILYLIAPKKAKNYVLLAFSLLFYAWGGVAFTLVLLGVVAIDYIGAVIIGKVRAKQELETADDENTYKLRHAAPPKKHIRKDKLVLVIIIAINLLILGYYKYAGFFVTQLDGIFGPIMPIPEIALPIGISFYTFQSMSYVIDVYRKQVDVQKNPLMLLLYVSMFPQLVAGPIVRYKDIAESLKERKTTWKSAAYGCERFIIGLAKKLIIANGMGELADTIYGLSDVSCPVMWLGALAYMLQIYYDFSAYSDMAIGLGRIFGFKFLENFNYPYISKSITEFWRRWHMSLGQWFRDYVYIPLGGNRKGLARQLLNIAIVWALTGFWHGAEWNFLLWGLYYAIFLVIEKCFLLKIWDKVPSVVRIIYTLIIVFFGWVLFRCEGLDACITTMGTLLNFGSIDAAAWASAWEYLQQYSIYFVLGIIFSFPIYPAIRKKLSEVKNTKARFALRLFGYVCLLALMFVSITFLAEAAYNPFIYFRF